MHIVFVFGWVVSWGGLPFTKSFLCQQLKLDAELEIGNCDSTVEDASGRNLELHIHSLVEESTVAAYLRSRNFKWTLGKGTRRKRIGGEVVGVPLEGHSGLE